MFNNYRITGAAHLPLINLFNCPIIHALNISFPMFNLNCLIGVQSHSKVDKSEDEGIATLWIPRGAARCNKRRKGHIFKSIFLRT